MPHPAGAGIRLAELLGVLSLAADLGMGQPMEHVLRQCLISMRLAQQMGLDEADREVVYYASLVAWVGCHVDAYEQAKWFGDDTALKSDFRHADFAAVTARPLFMLRHLGAGLPVAERARLGAAFLGDGRRAAEAMLENHWLAADGLAAQLGLPQRVRDSVEQTFERWDGKGVPKGAKGEQILLTSRLVTLADVVEVFHRAGGTEAAVAVAGQRRGTQFDPRVVDAFTGQAESLFAGLDEASSWDAVIGAEPALGARLAGPELDAALEAVADFTDVKSPYTIGHSRAVADLAAQAARISGLGDQAATLIRRAGLVHDLGRLGVPNTIWDKREPAQPRGDRTGAAASLPHRAHAGLLARARLAGRRRRAAPRAAGRLGIPARAFRRGAQPGGPDPGRRRLLPLADRATAAPGRLHRRRGGQPAAGRGAGGPAGRRRGRLGAVRGRPPGQPPPGQAGRADRP